MAGKEFGSKLVDWLRQFDKEIELVSDARCDQTLIEIYAGEAFRQLVQPVRFRVWRVSELEDVQTALANVEQEFWIKSAGRQHHALYDALRLKLLVETQAQQLAAE